MNYLESIQLKESEIRNDDFVNLISCFGRGDDVSCGEVNSSTADLMTDKSFLGFDIPVLKDFAIPFLTQSPGGFFVFGLLIAIVNKATKGKAIPKKEFSCEGCPASSTCHGAQCQEGGKNE